MLLKTLLASEGKGLRWMMTTTRHRRTSLPMGTCDPSTWPSTRANHGDGMALIGASQWGGRNYVDPLFPNQWTPQGTSYLDLFFYFFPMVWLKTILLAKTNMAVLAGGGYMAANPITFSELLQFLGIRLLMSTSSGWSQDEFWNYINKSMPRDQEADGCPYSFWAFMMQRRFRAISCNLSYTDANPPTFVDKFWEVRQMIKAWNAHMANIFLAGWVICLNKSMSIWHQRWMRLGWSNECHTACCALTNILFSIELVERKDSPPQVAVDFKEKGKTAGLLLQMLWLFFIWGNMSC